MKCDGSYSQYLINRAFQIIQFLLNWELLLEFVNRFQFLEEFDKVTNTLHEDLHIHDHLTSCVAEVALVTVG